MRRLHRFRSGLASLILLGALACGAPQDAGRVHDHAGFLSGAERASLQHELELLQRDTGVDVQMLFEPIGAGESIEHFSARMFETYRVGRQDSARRGVLFVYDTAGQQLRVEVAYGLETVLPDAFVGYLVQEHARYLFGAGEPERALRLAARILQWRLRSAQLGVEFDPAALPVRATHFGSGGAGATVSAPFGGNQSERPTTDDAWRAEFAASESVETTYQRYLDWLATGVFEPQVGLFTPETRAFLDEFPITPGYLDFVFYAEHGNELVVLERGDQALLYSRDNPLMAPHFFRKRAGRWQLDLLGELNEVENLSGAPYSWAFKQPPGPRLAAFSDQLVETDGFLRLRGGDNRKLAQAN